HQGRIAKAVPTRGRLLNSTSQLNVRFARRTTLHLEHRETPLVKTTTAHQFARLGSSCRTFRETQIKGGLLQEDYSLLPRCSVASGTILPNKPPVSSFGPAVKNNSIADPEVPLLPKFSAHRPSMTRSAPFSSSNLPSSLPVSGLKALMVPSPW